MLVLLFLLFGLVRVLVLVLVNVGVKTGCLNFSPFALRRHIGDVSSSNMWR